MNRPENMGADAIRRFLHAQVACWNAGDKAGFLEAYREAAPRGLLIEYVGRPASDGWAVLEAMWERQNAAVEIEEAVLIVNGNEAACHNRNRLRGDDKVIDTIELYRFERDGRLLVRYFIRQE
ncbi:nuclear transport factor 2 family protein [Massilia norwichensis]|uniref:Nuclear transport factor 2 family protein n=1 Tax=Massilia norwichensis TaxID=1442366 RepID=A0ABT2A155_9BURK|nr:nuclear transport factor 2 family protein [Massilia norwichensis]MCS0587912.1 nuclear transport factor 2 family protein [Massilia norwichensis]